MPLTEEQARDVLLAAIEAEVEYRHRTFSDNDDVRNAIRQMTRWLTSDNPKFGMLLCGGCGNGKSTFLKAFQTMLNYLQIPSPYNQGAYGIRIVDAKYASYLCRKDYAEFIRLAGYEMLGLDDLGTEPRELFLRDDISLSYLLSLISSLLSFISYLLSFIALLSFVAGTDTRTLRRANSRPPQRDDGKNRLQE